MTGAMDMTKRRNGPGSGARVNANMMGRMQRTGRGLRLQQQEAPVMNPVAQPVAVQITADFDDWLQKNKLGAIKAELAKSGITEMEDFMELEQSDLQYLGISHFHQKRLARTLFFPEQDEALRAQLQRQREQEEQDQRDGADEAKREHDATDPLGVRGKSRGASFVGHAHAKRVERRPAGGTAASKLTL